MSLTQQLGPEFVAVVDAMHKLSRLLREPEPGLITWAVMRNDAAHALRRALDAAVPVAVDIRAARRVHEALDALLVYDDELRANRLHHEWICDACGYIHAPGTAVVSDAIEHSQCNACGQWQAECKVVRR